MTWEAALPFFSIEELADRETGELKLDDNFAAQLPALRQAWGRPLSPTSVCRSAITNAEVGGHPRSLHLITNPVHPTTGSMAADIAWHDWSDQEQWAFFNLAKDLGWAVGLSDRFIQVDRRADIGLPAVTYTYPDWDDRFAL